MRRIDTLKKFQSKYKFVPQAELIREYFRIAAHAQASNNLSIALQAYLHGIRLGGQVCILPTI